MDQTKLENVSFHWGLQEIYQINKFYLKIHLAKTTLSVKSEEESLNSGFSGKMCSLTVLFNDALEIHTSNIKETT